MVARRPYNVKLKIAFEIDLEVVGVEEGTGKAANMMGALKLQSRDGLLKTDVGTGFRDTDRIDWWLNSVERIGSIVTVKANDIISNRNSDTKSLFLPVFLEHRLDKVQADNYAECVAQFEAAKGGK